MDQEKENYNAFVLRAYTKKELRLLYGIPVSSFRNWLKGVSQTSNTGRKNWLTVIQVEAIIKMYGVPGAQLFKKVTF
jgi:hypothetical protein